MDFLVGLATPITMGILLGGLYVVIALGLSLVFGVVREMNVAHGDWVILGSYVAYAMMTVVGIDPILSLIIGIPVFFGIGFAVQKFILNRAFQISLDATLLVCIGISLVIQNSAQIVWSPLGRGLTTPYALDSFKLGIIHVPLVSLLGFIMALIVMFVLRTFLKRTYLGKAITAASQDRHAAHLMGVNTLQVYAFAFAISMAMAAIAGVFLGLTFPFSPTTGIGFLIIALGVVVLGGLGSILGTFIGGIIFGLAQTLGAHFLGITAQMLVAYVMVLVVLAVVPKGIFGR
jgi:branched-chain amino acid transport system permease protein